ncbi:hypothetical protein [Bacteroides sp. 519]|uniref:hypothetical protein n=1 Tax=Bacteroides sp. 519 TaxID=2302937 RepID=UPI0013D4F21C|nr:hypothetical protein [Bacteroides sp. 519]NDV59334.1 DUF4906 domain-containing protein [Bacteroides sp. 519]
MIRILILYTISLMILFSSCAEEEVQGRYEEVYMNIATRSLDPTMTEVRIIATDALSGQVLINEYLAQREASGDYKLSVRTGQLNFYVVLNEPSALTPKLSAIQHHSAISSLILNSEDLPVAEPVDDSTTQTNLPAIGWTRALIRAASEGNKYGEASVDGGVNWNNSVTISLERMAAKVTFAVRKNTPVANDEITINKISITNVPQYEYLIPKAYNSQQFDTPLVYDSPLKLSANQSAYTRLLESYIIPEYLLTNVADKDMALSLKLEAEYKQRKVLYYIPIRENLDLEDYTIKRNNHYIIKATIVTEGETIYIPEINYQVAEWLDAGTETEFLEETAITFSRHWETNTNINGTDIRIDSDGYAEFYFTLLRPKGCTWTATLTNNIDFIFDNTHEAVSGGIARDGYEYKIRIKPRRETQLNDIKTEFYITVNNGINNVELNLPNQSTGTKSRYTIIQTPY